MKVPDCPRCGAGRGDVAWTGADSADGPHYWCCLKCGREWVTPAAPDSGE
jgi:hypothetical protein